MRFKAAYMRRYDRVFDAVDLEDASKRMAAALSALYKFGEMVVLSIHSVEVLPTYAEHVWENKSKDGIDMLPTIT